MQKPPFPGVFQAFAAAFVILLGSQRSGLKCLKPGQQNTPHFAA